MRLDLVHPATGEIVRRLWRRQMPRWPQQGFAQEGFLHDLESQGMSALVWYQLNQQQSLPGWPATVLHSLREYALREVAVEILWEEETLLVLKAMEENGIQPLLFKGAALSQAIYPQPGLRPRCDTDLLVPEAAREEAQLAMRSLGYQPLYEASVEHISGQMTWVKRGNSGVEYSHDLHWRIRNNHRHFSNLFSHEYLQAHAKPLPRFGNDARMLNLADALLLACVHRAGHLAHSGDRLIWLHDIHLLGEGLCEEDIERFCQTARKLDLEDLCGEAFA
ncbi:nucleotidyltransferase family protein, partial [Thiolapillus sp.]